MSNKEIYETEAYKKFKERYIRCEISSLASYHTEILEKEVGNLEDQSYWSLHDFWGTYAAEVLEYYYTEEDYYEDRDFKTELIEEFKEAFFVLSEEEIEKIESEIQQGTADEVYEYCAEYESKYILLAHKEDEEAYEREQEDEDEDDMFEDDDDK